MILVADEQGEDTIPAKDMIWDFNGIFHEMEYSWDVPWDGIFLGYPIPSHLTIRIVTGM